MRQGRRFHMINGKISNGHGKALCNRLIKEDRLTSAWDKVNCPVCRILRKK